MYYFSKFCSLLPISEIYIVHLKGWRCHIWLLVFVLSLDVSTKAFNIKLDSHKVTQNLTRMCHLNLFWVPVKCYVETKMKYSYIHYITLLLFNSLYLTYSIFLCLLLFIIYLFCSGFVTEDANSVGFCHACLHHNMGSWLVQCTYGSHNILYKYILPLRQ